MPTIREVYFKYLKECDSKLISKSILIDLLIRLNSLKDEVDLTTHYDDEFTNFDNFLIVIDRLKNGEMYEYIFNESKFANLSFYVNEDVLIPRQETEELLYKFISKLKYFYKKTNISIADICTGSGCLAIALNKEFQDAKIYATDISKEAIFVAKTNNESNNTDVIFYKGNLLDPLIENKIKVDAIICNPPYIGSKSSIDKRTWKYEPHLALLASPKTKHYKAIFKKCSKILNDKFILAFEIGEDMKDELTSLVDKYFPNCLFEFEKDMDNKDRFLFIFSKE